MSLMRGFPWNCETKWAQETRIMNYLAEKSLVVAVVVVVYLYSASRSASNALNT